MANHNFKRHDFHCVAIVNFTFALAIPEIRVRFHINIALTRATFRQPQGEKTKRAAFWTGPTWYRPDNKLRLFWIPDSNRSRNCLAKWTGFGILSEVIPPMGKDYTAICCKFLEGDVGVRLA
jgi:hypothetical protein